MCRRIHLIIVAGLTLSLLGSVAITAPIEQNLLTNPGFELSINTGWTVVGQFGRGTSGPSAYQGTYYLKPTWTASGAVYQEIDLAALGFDSHRLATGGYRARVEGYLYSGLPYSVGSITLHEYLADDSSNGSATVAQNGLAAWTQGIKYAGLKPGTTKLAYVFTATNTNTTFPNLAYLDAASLEISEYSIWAYGDTTSSILTRYSRTTDGNYHVGNSSIGEVNITRDKTWTTTGDYVELGNGSAGEGTVNITKGTWASNGSVTRIGDAGKGTVNIGSGAKWETIGDYVTFGRYASGRGTVNIDNGTWSNSATTTYIGKEGHGTVNIGSGGTWETTGDYVSISQQEDSDPGVPVYSRGTVNIEGGTWTNNANETHIGKGDGGIGKVTITDGGTWNSSKMVYISSPHDRDWDKRSTVIITNGSWNAGGNLELGVKGFVGLTIGAEGTWTTTGDSLKIGRDSNSDWWNDDHSAQITINGGTWSNSARLTDIRGSGDGYDNNTITVNSGGTWSTTGENVSLGGNWGEVYIDGGTWSNGATNTNIGHEGLGRVTVSNYGALNSSKTVSVGFTGESSLVYLSKGGSWTASGNVEVGASGKGTVSVGYYGGKWDTTGEKVSIGRDVGAEGSVSLTSNGTWSNSAMNTYVGDSGTGAVTIAGNGRLETTGDYVYIGRNSSAQGSISISDNGIWSNSAGKTYIGNGAGRGEVTVSGNGTFNVDGELVVGANGLLHVKSGRVRLRDTWTNNGEIRVTGGLLSVEHSGSLDSVNSSGGQISVIGASTILTADDALIGRGCTLSVSQDGTLAIGSNKTLNAIGTIQLADSTGIIQMTDAYLTHVNSQLDVNGGTIEGSGQVFVGTNGLDLGVDGTLAGTSPSEGLIVWGHVGGSGSLTNVTVYGNLNVGNSPGIISAGGLTLTSTSTLEMELGGLTAGTEHDQILVKGLLALDGMLDVVWYDNFEASLGDSFTLFDLTGGGSITGTFANELLPTFTDPTLSWDTSSLYTAGTITAVPEPATLLVIACGAVTLVRRKR